MNALAMPFLIVLFGFMLGWLAGSTFELKRCQKEIAYLRDELQAAHDNLSQAKEP